MQSLAEILGSMGMGQNLFSENFCETITQEERDRHNREKAQRDADALNAVEGNLNAYDGYECARCKNRGYIYVAQGAYVKRADCDCWTARSSIRRMKESGLESVIKRYTFERYATDETWQKQVKACAQAFVRDADGKWFFIGGASGAGKSHICTAICRELLRDKAVHYMLWEAGSKELRSCVMDAETYQPRMNRLKEIDVLYIDDFFSGHREMDGRLLKPTAAEVGLARELLNHRYINGKITIISSEWYSDEIFDIDEALGGRIVERCGRYCLNLERGSGKNYRLKLSGGTI